MMFKNFIDKKSLIGFSNMISNIAMPIACVLMVVLIYNIKELPHRMAAEISPSTLPDTVRETIIKTETANVQTSANFVYLDCESVGKSFKLHEKFKYDTRFPKEVYDGYLTKIRDRSGGLYYIWTSNMIVGDLSMKGYYFTDNITSFQEVNPMDKKDKPKYLQVMYPAIQSEFK